MIIIDKDGNKNEVEHNELTSKIEAKWNGLKATDIVIEKETGAISATLEKVGKYISCGWVEDYDNIYNRQDILAELCNETNQRENKAIQDELLPYDACEHGNIGGCPICWP